MGLFAVEVWYHRQIQDSDGQLMYNSDLVAIKTTLEDVFEFCRGNIDHAGPASEGKRSWHWWITEYKSDCAPEADQAFNHDEGPWSGSLHFKPEGQPCFPNGAFVANEKNLLYVEEKQEKERLWDWDDRQVVDESRNILRDALQLLERVRKASARNFNGSDLDDLNGELETLQDKFAELP